MFFREERHGGKVLNSLHNYMGGGGYVISTSPVTGDVDFDHLVKIIFSRFPHFRVVTFLFL